MKRVLYVLSLILFGLFWCVTVHAENIYVEDHANVLSSETKEQIYQCNQKYKELEQRSQLIRRSRALPMRSSINWELGIKSMILESCM
ncbi:MAG: hypothetical protein ACLTXM_07265 [Enterococcus sp.]